MLNLGCDSTTMEGVWLVGWSSVCKLCIGDMDRNSVKLEIQKNPNYSFSFICMHSRRVFDGLSVSGVVVHYLERK